MLQQQARRVALEHVLELVCQHTGELLRRPRALEQPTEENHLAARDGERVHRLIVDHSHAERVRDARPWRQQQLDDRVDGRFPLRVHAAASRRRELLHGRLAEPLFP